MDFPSTPAPPVLLSLADPRFSEVAIAGFRAGQAFNASFAWQVANAATFVPYRLESSVAVVKMMITVGAATSGNVDVGIYDLQGVRRVSAGSTALAATSTLQTFDVTDTVLEAGLYYLACTCDNTTGAIMGSLMGYDLVRLSGTRYMASAFPLPATATLAAMPTTTTRCPHIVATCRSVI